MPFSKEYLKKVKIAAFKFYDTEISIIPSTEFNSIEKIVKCNLNA